MTDADLDEAIKTAWHVLWRMNPVRTNGKYIKEAEDHLAHLMAAQRQRVQLGEAKEAAAKADKTAEGLYWGVQSQKDVAEKRLKKIRKLEQTLQTIENALSRQQDEAARLRGKLGEANRCNENQRQLIQTLRENSATALIQKMRDDIRDYETAFKVDYYTIDQLKKALDRYEREYS